MEFRIEKSTPVIPHQKHWQFCVGSGHALLALRADYARQLAFIHDTLGIRRVRFHGIFCDDMRTFNDLSMMHALPGSETFEEYNFNACGAAYDNVLPAGMKPFVELSLMPGKLARKKDGIAAFRKGKASQVLLFRQKMKNLDLPKEKAVVRFEMAEKPEKVTLRRVDSEHGNPLSLWEGMGAPLSLNRAEVQEIKEKSDVKPEEWPFVWENGVLTLEAELGVNDVYFFEIEAK